MANFGETLRRERELRDISLREIADATKVNLRYLEALEQNRFDILPGGVFNKGFIRAYARFIGADGEAFVDSYLQAIAAREAQANSGGAAPAPAGMHRPSESPRRRAGAEAAAPVGAAATTPPTPAPAPTADPKAAVITFAEERVRPIAATAHAPHTIFMESVASRAGTKRDSRPMIIAAAVVGVAAIGLLGFWLIRGLRPAAPRRSAVPPPAAATGPASAIDGAATTTGGAAVTPATYNMMNPAMPAGGIDTGAGATEGPTMTPASDASPVSAPGPIDPAPGSPTLQAEPARRDGPLDRLADPTGTPRQATTPPRVQIASPVAPPQPGLAAAAPQTDPQASGLMEFRIEATAPVWVQVACDGDDRLNRALQQGEGVTLRCLSFIRLSVTDIGAVHLMVNGGRCAAPGERGSRIEGFVIRAEDAAVICPNQQRGAHGRG